MSTVTGDRRATLDELLAHRDQLRAMTVRHQLEHPRLGTDGSLVVHPANPGYLDVARFVDEASRLVGAHVYVVTDDVPGVEATASQL